MKCYEDCVTGGNAAFDKEIVESPSLKILRTGLSNTQS